MRTRCLSHEFIFNGDLFESIKFYEPKLGLCLSGKVSDMVVFMRGIHGSDHHMLGLPKLSAPGFHHWNWEIGLGATRTVDKGYTKGCGKGPHAFGSNCFQYVKDPWGRFSE